MKARSFRHVGITVSDFNKAVRFYWDVFKCPLVGVADTPPDRVRTFFGVDAPAPRCKIGWIRTPGGGVLEIFEFQPQQSPAAVPWHRVGLTHISFNVRNLGRWHFDSNLIELMDLGYMYYVLGWLGPLGGWLFRRAMYAQYYR
jgi:catechol 2,3-dioxygenase-like lactoylglutathione lyase family enzyme